MDDDARSGLVEMERLIATIEYPLQREDTQLVIEVRALVGGACPASCVLDPSFLETLRNAAAALRVALTVRR